MRRFEYKATCKVVTDNTPATDGTLAKLAAELNVMGDEGWELVQRKTARMDNERTAVWDVWKREK